MKIKRVYSKYVEAPLIRGRIHGQGPSKRYSFVILETDEGIGMSELYPGVYSKDLMDACLCEIQKQFLNNVIVNEIWDIKKALHIPFISGNGMYQACIGAVINGCTFKSVFCVRGYKIAFTLLLRRNSEIFTGRTRVEAEHAAKNGYQC